MLNILTPIPGQLARSTDVVEKTVSSDLIIHQESHFALPPVPQKFAYQGERAEAALNLGLQSSSWFFNLPIARNGINAAIAQTILDIAPGFWKLHFWGHLVHSALAVVDGVPATAIQLSLATAGAQQLILKLLKQQIVVLQDFDLEFVLVLTEETTLGLLIEANVAGDQMSFSLHGMGSRYL